jgi:hypothetical protein
VIATNRTNTKAGTILAAAVAAIGLTGAAGARADADPVALTVVNRETGQTLRTWRHHGRLFVAGEPGARYGLRVTNHTDGRVLVVMSVDGVNILTGETADYGQRGYVLNPYGSTEVTGWRKSNSEVAAFAFAPLSQSYAARTGRPTDVGVIGMAVFRERVAEPPSMVEAPVPRPEWREQARRGGLGDGARAVPAPSAMPAPPPSASRSSPADGLLARRDEEKLGTAHGAREWSVVSETAFERATPFPWRIRRIEYDTYAHLLASGVIPPSPYAEYRPRPFPRHPDGAGFVPDPPDEP